jgi:hypothetical protein
MRKILLTVCLSGVLAACGGTTATTPPPAPTAAMMAEKPTDAAMMAEKPTDAAMMAEKPTDAAMAEKPTDAAMAEKPTDAAMMAEKPTDAAMMAEPLPANARVLALKYIAGLSNAGPKDAMGTLTLLPDTNTIIVDVKGLLPVAGKVYSIRLLPAADAGGRFSPSADGTAHFEMKLSKELKMYHQLLLTLEPAASQAAKSSDLQSLASEPF